MASFRLNSVGLGKFRWLAPMLAAVTMVLGPADAAPAIDDSILPGALAHSLERNPALLNARDEGGATMLMRELRDGRIDLARILLQRGADPNAANRRWPALDYAIASGRPELVRLMLAYGARPDAPEGSLTVPLQQAVLADNPEMVQLLLNRGAAVNRRNEFAQTALHLAVIRGDAEIARLLIAHGAWIRAHDCYGLTPLHLAAQRSTASAIILARLLMNHGADPNARTMQGETPLHLTVASTASAADIRAMTDLLLRSGADANLRDNRGDTPMHIALRRGDALFLPLLMARSNGHLTDGFGMTPLQIALLNHDTRAVALLRNRATEDLTSSLMLAAADNDTTELTALLARDSLLLQLRAPDGSTLLHIAALWGAPGAVRTLLAVGTPLDAADSQGRTPLLRALEIPNKRSLETIAVLLGAGANPNARDIHKTTALHLAAAHGNLPAMRLLLAARARVDLMDENGRTADDVAVAGGYGELVGVLRGKVVK